MAGIDEQSKIKNEGEIRYLSPLDINTSKAKKYCMFRRSGIKYVDYKDPDFNSGIKKLIKFSNANNMSFIKFNTDRGQHFFLASHKFDHKDVLASHIMMSLDIDPWYTAFCYAIGYGIRINTKEGRREDKVAFRSSIKPGALTPEESKLVFEQLEKGDYSSNNVILRRGNLVQVSEPTVDIKLSDGKVYKFRYMDKKFYKDGSLVPDESLVFLIKFIPFVNIRGAANSVFEN